MEFAHSVTLNIGSGRTESGGTVEIPLSLEAGTPAPATLFLDIDISSLANVVDVQAGTEAIAAGKSVWWHASGAGTLSIVVGGLDASGGLSALSDGELVLVTFGFDAGIGDVTVPLKGVSGSAAEPDASRLAVSFSVGTIDVTTPPPELGEGEGPPGLGEGEGPPGPGIPKVPSAGALTLVALAGVLLLLGLFSLRKGPRLFSFLLAFSMISAGATAAHLAGDFDGTGAVDDVDLQLLIDSALGRIRGYLTDVDYSGATDAVDYQIVLTAMLGQTIDTDGDGLSDEGEANLGSDPGDSDTDNDGVNDGEEVIYGDDPLVARAEYVIINEFLASNGNGLADGDGDTPDWIELYNPGSTPVNLANWTLTDDDGEPGKWVFPNVTLGAGEYLVVFASGKDLANTPVTVVAGISDLHTSFQLSQSGEYLALYNDLGEVQPSGEFDPQYPEQVTDVSFGWHATAPGLWYFEPPTPGQPNVGGIGPLNVALSLGPGPITIYVSNSEGDDDTNNGRTEDSPFKTLGYAKTFLRDGASDSLLLKRGDVWDESFGTWEKSGRSPDEPMLIGSYLREGDDPINTPRPRVGDPDDSSVITVTGDRADNLTIRDIEFATLSVKFLGPMQNLRLEYCYFAQGLGSIQSKERERFGGAISNVTVYRCVVVDSYDTEGHAQGFFISGVAGVLIEECLFDHNGWHETIPGAEQTIFNHNAYIVTNNTDVVVRGNIFARASSHGIQMRPGGLLEGNLFVRNAIGLSFGYVLGSDPTEGGVTGEIVGNVILEGTDIHTVEETEFRAFGMEIGNVKEDGLLISDNIIAHTASGWKSSRGIDLHGNNGVGVHQVVIEDNIIYDWHSALIIRGPVLTGNIIRNNEVQDIASPFPGERSSMLLHYEAFDQSAVAFSGNTYFSFRNPAEWFYLEGIRLSFEEWVAESGEVDALNQQVVYPDPNRDLGTYNGSLGGTATFEAFAEEARKQSRDNWREEYTAAAVIAYIREGFGR